MTAKRPFAERVEGREEHVGACWILYAAGEGLKGAQGVPSVLIASYFLVERAGRGGAGRGGCCSPNDKTGLVKCGGRP